MTTEDAIWEERAKIFLYRLGYLPALLACAGSAAGLTKHAWSFSLVSFVIAERISWSVEEKVKKCREAIQKLEHGVSDL